MDIAAKLSEYGNFHQNKKNVITHFIGIPLIVFALMLWTSWIIVGVPGYFTLPLSLILTLALIALYATDNLKNAGISAIYLLPLLAVAYLTHFANVIHPNWVALGCFVVGWIIQFIGHMFEAQKPAFMDNIVHLLVGPLFIILEMQELFKKS